MSRRRVADTAGSSRHRGPNGGGRACSRERADWVRNPENWCQRNHSDTLAKLIRRHDAIGETSDTGPPPPPQAPDQGFRENESVGGGTLTGFLWVPTHNNPRFPAPRGTWEATGRRQTVMSAPLVTGESTPRTDVARADDRADDEWRSFADVDAPMAAGASRTHPSRLGRRYTHWFGHAQRAEEGNRVPSSRRARTADGRAFGGHRSLPTGDFERCPQRTGHRSMIACSDRRVTYVPATNGTSVAMPPRLYGRAFGDGRRRRRHGLNRRSVRRG
jgi:hypothetical protein